MSPEFRDINLPGTIYRIDELEKLLNAAVTEVDSTRDLLETRQTRVELLSDLLYNAKSAQRSEDTCPEAHNYTGDGEHCTCGQGPCCFCGVDQNAPKCRCDERSAEATDLVSFEYGGVQRTVRLDITNSDFISGLEEARGDVRHSGIGLYKRFNWAGIRDLVIECEC